ncbi:uncharacterized protein LOC34617464 [Cyclospora cayetanensis]|uniref:Uncharacterized protein LOC34617464 n=1 Tax=Cyclospora cayetanensis TaxID=88456 RepID=A0A6P6S2L3_9EIME|nr:uncharacterized protein LOC34617464 [Cyclospora cayetanensis]
MREWEGLRGVYTPQSNGETRHRPNCRGTQSAAGRLPTNTASVLVASSSEVCSGIAARSRTRSPFALVGGRPTPRSLGPRVGPGGPLAIEVAIRIPQCPLSVVARASEVEEDLLRSAQGASPLLRLGAAHASVLFASPAASSAVPLLGWPPSLLPLCRDDAEGPGGPRPPAAFGGPPLSAAGPRCRTSGLARGPPEAPRCPSSPPPASAALLLAAAAPCLQVTLCAGRLAFKSRALASLSLCAVLLPPHRSLRASHLENAPSRAQVNSFFTYLMEEPLASVNQQLPPQQHAQRHLLPSLSAAVDGVLFLAGCAVSPQCGVALARIDSVPHSSGLFKDPARPLLSSPEAPPTPQPPQRRLDSQGKWLLLCGTSLAADPPEALPVEALTRLFVSLQQMLPRLPRSAITRLLAPLFALGCTIGLPVAASSSSEDGSSPGEVQALAQAVSRLLQGVLLRAAAETPTLPAREIVQRISTVCTALSDWTRRGSSCVRETADTPLLLLADSGRLGKKSPHRQECSLQGASATARAAAAAAAALAAALQSSEAQSLPDELLHAIAAMIESSAAAASRGLRSHNDGESLQPTRSGSDLESFPPTSHQHCPQETQSDPGGPLPKEAVAEEMRQLVGARASWLPVFYELMRLSGGVGLPAVQQLAETAAAQAARLLQLFLSHSPPRQTDGCSPTSEAPSSAWAAVGRLLYGEVQQLATSLARLHSLRPLKGMRQLAATLVAFDRFLATQDVPNSADASPASQPFASKAAEAPAAAACSPSALSLRPLVHTREPPLDLKEAERRIRFFCALVTLGASGSSLSSGVAACLPSERQLHALTAFEMLEYQKRQKSRFLLARAEAATKSALQLPLQLLQRLLFACSWIEEWPLVTRVLTILRRRLEVLTLQHFLRSLHETDGSTRDGEGTPGAAGKAADAEASHRENYTAELVGKTLALLHKTWVNRGRFHHVKDVRTSRSTPASAQSQGALLAAGPSEGEGASRLQAALYGLASTATLWAAVRGFDKQQPEDIALLTFSLIPFWTSRLSARASPMHTEEQVRLIRDAAVAAEGVAAGGSHEASQGKQPQTQQQPSKGTWAEHQQLETLSRSLRGLSTFSPAWGVASPVARFVHPAAVEFYVSELRRKKSYAFRAWPAPLLFLLGYNVLRLRRTKAVEAPKGPASTTGGAGEVGTPRAATTRAEGGDAAAAALAQQQQQQQLSSEAEAEAAALLLEVVAAMEEGVTFPHAVNAYCDAEAAGIRAADAASPASFSPAGASSQSATTPLKALVAGRGTGLRPPRRPTAPAQLCTIRLAGLREVGSFLWALSRAERGLGAPLSGGPPGPQGTLSTAETTAATRTEKAALGAAAAAGSFAASLSRTRAKQPLTLQEASRTAAQMLKRSGGLADKLAVYCEAAIRAANDFLLQQQGGHPQRGLRANAVDGRRPLLRAGARLVASEGPLESEEETEKQRQETQSVFEVLKSFTLNGVEAPPPAVSLLPAERPHMSWVSTAGVSLGLLLNCFSSCGIHARQRILSGVLHAPALVAECGLLQLFHLLRPLAAAARVEMESAEQLEGKTPLPVKQAQGAAETQAVVQQQQEVCPLAGNGSASSTRSSSSSHSEAVLVILREAPAFLFAVTAALLRHARVIADLPPEAPRTAGQVQLLLLAASDFAALLHAHCRWTGGAVGDYATPRQRASLVTESSDFRRALHQLLSLVNGIVLRHASQVCGSLSLLAAAAEILSRCGRQVPPPKGTMKAVEAFASAAIAALRQPAAYHAATQTGDSSSDPSGKDQLRTGGPEELRRLATALEALKFVELQ